MSFPALLRRIISGERLTVDESAALVRAIVDGQITPNQTAGVLVALASRGEHGDEIAGAVRAVQERAVALDHDSELLVDIVGTGGDGKGTINISTMASLIVAAAGIPVAKHGNRAASGICGSADVLEAAGFPIELEPEACARMLAETNFTFLFAPRFHPAMRTVAHVRRELGVRTIFNYLGPLTNPARPTYQVVGVAAPQAMATMASVFEVLGMRGVVLCGAGGLDEVAGEGISEAIEFTGGSRIARTIDPQSFGVRASLEDLAGPTIEACRDAFFEILAGERSARSGVVALNAAVAIAGALGLETLREGLERAQEVLQSGEALRVFERAKALARG